MDDLGQCVPDMTTVEDARRNIRHHMQWWHEGRPEGSQALESALRVLVAHAGGDRWIDSHPHSLREPNPPLHAAGYRSEDMRRYRQLFSLQYGSRWIHLHPEDGEALLV